MIRDPLIIKDMHRSSIAALRQLEHQRELSFYRDTATLLGKALLLTCASYYETTITDLLRDVVERVSFHPGVKGWITNACVEEKFFKWFDFRNAKNTNRFFALFGDGFKSSARALIDAKAGRQQAERSFLLLCTKRNECVHNDFGTYNLDLTLDDVYREHRRAMQYVRAVELLLGRELVTG